MYLPWEAGFFFVCFFFLLPCWSIWQGIVSYSFLITVFLRLLYRRIHMRLYSVFLWFLYRRLVSWKFPNLGACELKISKFGGLWAKIWVKISKRGSCELTLLLEMGPLRAAGEVWKGGLQGRTSPYSPFLGQCPPRSGTSATSGTSHLSQWHLKGIHYSETKKIIRNMYLWGTSDHNNCKFIVALSQNDRGPYSSNSNPVSQSHTGLHDRPTLICVLKF